MGPEKQTITFAKNALNIESRRREPPVVWICWGVIPKLCLTSICEVWSSRRSLDHMHNFLRWTLRTRLTKKKGCSGRNLFVKIETLPLDLRLALEIWLNYLCSFSCQRVNRHHSIRKTLKIMSQYSIVWSDIFYALSRPGLSFDLHWNNKKISPVPTIKLQNTFS